MTSQENIILYNIHYKDIDVNWEITQYCFIDKNIQMLLPASFQ